MVDDNEPDHSGNADVQKVAHGEVIVLLEVLHDHGDELKVKKKDQDLLEEFTEGRLVQECHLGKVNQFLAKQINKDDGEKNERRVQNLLEQQWKGELLECRFQMVHVTYYLQNSYRTLVL